MLAQQALGLARGLDLLGLDRVLEAGHGDAELSQQTARGVRRHGCRISPLRDATQAGASIAARACARRWDGHPGLAHGHGRLAEQAPTWSLAVAAGRLCQGGSDSTST